MKCQINRRQFLGYSALGLAGLTILPSQALSGKQEKLTVFDGKTLNGWQPMPRLYLPRDARFSEMAPDDLCAEVIKWYEQNGQQERVAHTGRWEVIDGAIVGGHDPVDSFFGAYLVSEKKFGDFELELDANPDWPIDTGIMIRANKMATLGFQVLVDHRPNGNVGGIFGNSLGSFLATGYYMNGDRSPGFKVKNLRVDESVGNFANVKPEYAASFDEFKKVWNLNDWNHFKIRCVGRIPLITIWINGTKICELNTANIVDVPGFDPEMLPQRLGSDGHIAFEVHDVEMRSPLARDRWEVGAKCRWKNITVMPLS